MKPLHSFSRIQSVGRRARRAGFSIAELMVVILIIGLLATQVVPRVLDRLGDAKWGKVRGDLSTLQNAIKTYAIRNGGEYPDSLERLVERDSNGKSFLEQTEVPKDPWNNEYHYLAPEGNRDMELWCYGKDGAQGGEGDDRDLSAQMVLNGEK
ncbi:MAG: type II secretion system major pseudopilin GspG [Planctomycetes bacterium]|nr:type II secretion system major pseudopilin GspG [Planctomycetota bacterium]MCB9909200.1 type II secretion system major pseudopilin GspG [Planctomycetota bacterium]MCB9913318.1 type II secretion system major pseudopilin GspG [Planctomycetota bacterium]HRV81315.1 type II secretion system major pseudopilin GspG [Planctomycetota bacterium]